MSDLEQVVTLITDEWMVVMREIYDACQWRLPNDGTLAILRGAFATRVRQVLSEAQLNDPDLCAVCRSVPEADFRQVVRQMFLPTVLTKLQPVAVA